MLLNDNGCGNKLHLRHLFYSAMEQIFKPKIFTVLMEQYSRKQFSSDVLAGIVVGVVALPLAVAFAVASGVSPEKGLITAIVAGFLISFLGVAGFRLAVLRRLSLLLFLAYFPITALTAY